MKLHSSILEKIIELPSTDPKDLRMLLDDLGLEVKDISTEGGKAVFNIETLANRGDHLYALGVAREISARQLTAIKYPQIAADFAGLKSSLPVRVLTDKCSRYALLAMDLPSAMKLRPDVAMVMGAGGSEGAHHPIVDLTNYVLLELGQPMHAFDRDKIDGEIIVELSKEPEEIEALDGKVYKVPVNSILIRDRKKTVAVAGIIGCANSMVTPDTKRVLLESALFDPVTVRKTARAMAISTDASYAFERGCDREGVVPALRRLVVLAEGSGAESVHVVGLTYHEGQPTEKRKVPLNLPKLKKQLNAPRLADVEITSRLKNLGYGVEAGASAGEIKLTVPSWRLWDVQNEDDLIEDVARSQSLSRIKLELPALDYEVPAREPIEECQIRLERALHGQGFYEVITKSLYSAEEVGILSQLDTGIAERHVQIKNSVESSNSHAKITNVLNLCNLAQHNLKRGVLAVKVYEFGRLFSLGCKEESDAKAGFEYERDVLTLGVSGRWYDHEWKKAESLEQMLSLFRGSVEVLFQSLGQELVVGESKEKFLHPGMQGSLKAGRAICGFFGVVHPAIKQALNMRYDVLYAELDMSRLCKLTSTKAFSLPSEFPMVRRDLTLKVELRELASRVIRYVDDMKVANLQDVVVVDDFLKGEEQFRRLSLRFSFQSAERTLESGEIDGAMANILSTLKDKHQIEMAV